MREKFKNIVTNPPYKLAHKFIEQANEFLNNYEAGLEAPASRTIGELLNARVKARSPCVERHEVLVEHATALKKYWEHKYPEQVEDHLKL